MTGAQMYAGLGVEVLAHGRAKVARHRRPLVEQGRVDGHDQVLQMVIEPEDAKVLDVGLRVLVVSGRRVAHRAHRHAHN